MAEDSHNTKRTRLSITDFLLPAVSKFPIVFLSNFFLPLCVFGIAFVALRWSGAARLSVYLGDVTLCILMMFCIFAAVRFNSRVFIRWAWKARQTNPLLKLPHPVVKDIDPGESVSKRVTKMHAMLLLDAKAFSASYGISFGVLYVIFLYFVAIFQGNLLSCKGNCDVVLYAIKSLGSGIIFDFFDAFHIEISNIAAASIFVLSVSFIAKIVFTSFVLHFLLSYMGMKRRFRLVLRSSALSVDEAKDNILFKQRPELLRPPGIRILWPPFLKPFNRTPWEAPPKGSDEHET